ncbi:MAG TPA: hypothetical protein VHQ86_01520 [Candidatus Saccharimonadia bacterium]|jgi:hypothetical protein|nr:hypothetical protein [Candidatus Saccharimonadia bacterium]
MTAPRPKKSKVPGPWSLMRESARELIHHWKRYSFIISIVAVPVSLLGLSAIISADNSVNVYSFAAIVVMNVALVWAIVKGARTGVLPKARAAYYEGSAALVRFVIVSFLMFFVMMIPAALGAAIYTASLISTGATPSSSGEEAIILAFCIAISLFSVWLLVRFGLGLVITVDTDLRPISALRYARMLTLGRFWPMVWRYLGWIVMILLAAVIPTLMSVLLGFLKLTLVAEFLFPLLSSILILPLANIYLFKLYASLEPPRQVKAKALEEEATE